MRAKKPHPSDEGASEAFAVELQIAENDREAWGCPGPLAPGGEADLAAEARYAAEVLGLKEPFEGCPFREALRPTHFHHDVQSATAAMGEVFSPAAWRAITGRDPTARDVDAYLLVRRAQGDVLRSDDDLRKQKPKKD